MLTVEAQNIKAGMWIENIGSVDSVDLYEGAQLVRITCTVGLVMSAAFFWYRFTTPLKVRTPNV